MHLIFLSIYYVQDTVLFVFIKDSLVPKNFMIIIIPIL